MPGPRDPWLDNAKMLLIITVVAGHMTAPLSLGTPLSGQIYDALYLIHMPAFVLVTGYLSRTFQWSRRHLTSLVTTLVVPYVIFSSALWGLQSRLQGDTPEKAFLVDPYWSMWFLAVLVFWRLATPVLRSTRWMIPISIVVSLLAPAVNIGWFDLDRALQFLPFFVIGLHLPASWLAAVRRPWTPLLGIAGLVVIWQIAGDLDSWASTSWVYYTDSYADLGVDSVGEGMSIRAPHIAISLLGTAALLTLVPRRRSWFTTLGAATMTVYLGHAVIVRTMLYTDVFPELARLGEHLAIVVTAAIAVVVACVLAMPPVASALRVVTDPVGLVLERRRARRSERPEQPDQQDGSERSAPTPERSPDEGTGRDREPAQA